MTVAVCGLWHLGSVIAACMARRFPTVGYDPAPDRIASLSAAVPPVSEPGLPELLREGLHSGRLRFTSDRAQALAEARLVWIAYDTPVDDHDRADVRYVEEQLEDLLPFVPTGAVLAVSSQVPVGFLGKLEKKHAGSLRERGVTLACIPENLRLGRAIEGFERPDRIVVGLTRSEDRERLAPFFPGLTDRILWTDPASAEMIKHALNAFLGMSVAFANEVAGLAERVGADARDVAKGLKSDPRVGPHAMVNPGAAFSGGTLARDLGFLSGLGRQSGLATPIVDAVLASNAAHAQWPLKRLEEGLGGLRGRRIAVLGLSYKPGTDTLRRSHAIDLCVALHRQGADVRAFDPAVSRLPADLQDVIRTASTPMQAIEDAEAVVVATPWPEFAKIDASSFRRKPALIVVDPHGLLEPTLGRESDVRYFAVGRSGRAS